MENAPAIILFWYSAIVILIFVVVLAVTASILIKKGHGSKTMRSFGKICLLLSVVGSVPMIFAVGYILYLYIT